jgi:hypothetical protein
VGFKNVLNGIGLSLGHALKQCVRVSEGGLLARLDNEDKGCPDCNDENKSGRENNAGPKF